MARNMCFAAHFFEPLDARDFDSLMETGYLLRSPANAARLRQALDEFDSGKGLPLDAHAIVDAESFEG